LMITISGVRSPTSATMIASLNREPGMRKIITVVVMAIGLLTVRPALFNEDTTSGSYYLRHGCKPDLTKTLTQLEAFETGWCSGTIYGLHYAADMKTICSPPDVTVTQEVGVVTSNKASLQNLAAVEFMTKMAPTISALVR